MLDIPVATIRNWEERYVDRPERSSGDTAFTRAITSNSCALAAEVSAGSRRPCPRLLAEGQPANQDGPDVRACSCALPNAIRWRRTSRSSSCAPRV
jgi:hypothetical protein